jgi:hypothetical protein
MASNDLDDDDWDLIVDRIREGTCVAFLGAGANAPAEGESGLPLGRQVAAMLAEELTGVEVGKFSDLAKVEPFQALSKYEELLRLGLYDLPRVAFYVELRKDPAFLMEKLAGILDDSAYPLPPALKTVARLPFPLIVTTNYDNLMERALRCVGVEFRRVVQPMGGFDEKERRDLNEELVAWGDRLVLYKIHGSFCDPHAESDDGQSDVIVTEEDYIRYLTVANVAGRGLPNAVGGRLAANTILYLGYSLEDWDFRTIFKTVMAGIDRPSTFRSFAFQWKPSRYWTKFWAKQNVDIVDMDVTSFATELADRCAEYIRPEPDWTECP